ncbi:hypothetical protein [Cereibacter azotoformans]|nr:hypothetical protein [Cereibacter azotoformans]
MLVDALDFCLEDTGDGTDPSFDHEAAAELTAILQQAREALGQ